MKRKHIIISAVSAGAFLSCLFIFGYTYLNNKTVQPNNVYIPERGFVDAFAGLVLRAEPGVNGQKIGLIPYGEKVNIVERSSIREKISGREGVWMKVSWKTEFGWVFGGFLSDTPTPFQLPEGAYIVSPFNFPGRHFAGSSSFDVIEIRASFTESIYFNKDNTFTLMFGDSDWEPEENGTGGRSTDYSTTSSGRYWIEDGKLILNIKTIEKEATGRETEKESVDIREEYICARRANMDIIISSEGKFFLDHHKE